MLTIKIEIIEDDSNIEIAITEQGYAPEMVLILIVSFKMQIVNQIKRVEENQK